MTTFKALESSKTDNGNKLSIVEKSIDDLPEGEILVKVNYSSLNYKDALSASGAPGVTRNYPHTPGIDAAGVIAESSDNDFKEGDSVIVTGYDLGMDTAGGFGEYIRVPASWVIRMPKGLSESDSMALGTAGLTAGLSVQALNDHNSHKGFEGLNTVVTGATGGVGSIAVMLLSKLGASVTAVTGKDAQKELQTLQNDLLAPVVEKIQNAINDVAKDGKYSYILDTGSGFNVILFNEGPDSNDITSAVKKKLKL